MIVFNARTLASLDVAGNALSRHLNVLAALVLSF
jgi:hypothetical protein